MKQNQDVIMKSLDFDTQKMFKMYKCVLNWQDFENSNELEELYMNECNLSSIPIFLNKIKILDLRDNCLTDTKFLGSFYELEFVYLHNNCIESVPVFVSDKLKHFTLYNNPVFDQIQNQIIKNQFSDSWLKLQNISLQIQDNSQFSFLRLNSEVENFQLLYPSKPLKLIVENTKVNCEELKNKKLYSVILKNCDVTLNQIDNIKEFQAINCGLQHFISVSFMLRYLNLMKNQISELSFLQGLPNLQILMLDENNISNLNELINIKHCPKLKQLTLKLNPVCDDPYFMQAIEFSVMNKQCCLQTFVNNKDVVVQICSLKIVKFCIEKQFGLSSQTSKLRLLKIKKEEFDQTYNSKKQQKSEDKSQLLMRIGTKFVYLVRIKRLLTKQLKNEEIE